MKRALLLPLVVLALLVGLSSCYVSGPSLGYYYPRRPWPRVYHPYYFYRYDHPHGNYGYRGRGGAVGPHRSAGHPRHRF